jgi:heat shock protein HspQ
MTRLFALLFMFCCVSQVVFAAADPNTQIQFNRDIRPILADACFHCHGPDPGSRKVGLRLDTEAGFFGDRTDGPTVKAGKPAESPLFQRITSTDTDEVMPPPKAHRVLKPEEKEAIRLWIAQGAQWQPHWSFIKPEAPPPPVVKNKKWAREPLDTFILAKLEANNLQPAPEADRRTLARRAALDLTGLPPSLEKLDTFLADKSPDAYEKYVDSLMASPQYGEHRARYWLDAARYADTHGLHFDNYREMWLYRDWVIKAINNNMPFDQFTIEQLAGDLLPKPTEEQLIATGFHRCNMTTNEGGTIPEENLAMYARDRVETTSWVWLGLTANCAVCHDHKFDPITQKDFYAMSAFFRNTTQGALDGNIRDSAPVLRLPMGDDAKRWDALPAEIGAAKKTIEERKKAIAPEFDTWLANAKPDEWVASVDKNGAPALYFPFNEEKPIDQIPATVKGAATTVKASEAYAWEDGGKYGKAPKLNGKTVIALPEAGDYDKEQKYSYGCWLKLDKDHSGSGAIMARMDDGADFRGWDLWVQDKEIGAHFINKWPDDAMKVVTVGNTLKPGNWQHVFVTYDGSGKAEGVKVYVDGKVQKVKFEQNRLKSTIKSTAPLTVGQRKNGNKLDQALVQDLRLYDREVSDAEVRRLAVAPRLAAFIAQPEKDRQKKDRDELFGIFTDGDAQLAAANDSVQKLEAEQKAIKDRAPVTHIMEEKKDSKPMAYILDRGEYDKKKDQVDAAVIQVLHKLPEGAPHNRLGLAQWLVSRENPLTPRVIVNRIWQEFFGTGIVKTAEDFGIMGDAPSNQLLLDQLAADFRGDWDMKRLVRSIVTSSAYRQSAQTTPDKIDKDPENRWISRGPRFRMDAEMIRDYALEAAGLLSTHMGGPSVHPYQPEGIWDVVGMPESNTRHYKQDTGEALYRRSVYTFWKRAAPPPSMEILNAPSREVSCVRRERTNTPLQALVTLNGPQFIEAARVLAERSLKATADDNSCLDRIALRVLCRPLNAAERDVVMNMKKELAEHYAAAPADAKTLIEEGERKPDPALEPVKLATWTMVCNQMLNLDEALNK